MKSLLYVLVLFLIYISVLGVFKTQIFYYQFDPALLEQYLRSQDNYYYPLGDRAILSDTDIYIGSGYFYATGGDPAKIDFQHPPLVKYLYGFSAVLFGNPFIVQILLGMVLISVTYLMGLKYSSSKLVAFSAGLLLVVDPLMIDVSSQAFLDMALAAFTMSYIYCLIYRPKNFWLQGLFLGLSAASKFWSVAVFFFAFPIIYRLLIRDKINIKRVILSIFVAIVVFLSTYTMTFIYNNGLFNVVFFELKTLRFMLNHTSASYPGSSIILFLTGFFYSWWDNRNLLRYETWSPLWPVVFILTLFSLKNFKKFVLKDLVIVTPIIYLLYINAQASFTRYFIIALPYFYIILATALIAYLKKRSHLTL